MNIKSRMPRSFELTAINSAIKTERKKEKKKKTRLEYLATNSLACQRQKSQKGGGEGNVLGGEGKLKRERVSKLNGSGKEHSVPCRVLSSRLDGCHPLWLIRIISNLMPLYPGYARSYSLRKGSSCSARQLPVLRRNEEGEKGGEFA